MKLPLRTLISAWLPVALCMAAIFIVSADSNPYRVLPLQADAPAPAGQTGAPGAGGSPAAVGDSNLIGPPTGVDSPAFHYARRTPQQDLAVEVIGSLSHVAEYALLALLSARALRLSGGGKRAWLLAALLCLLFALGDELHQELVPGRRFQVSDLLLDLAGTALGLAAAWGLSQTRIMIEALWNRGRAPGA